MGRTVNFKGIFPRETSILIDLRGIGYGRQTLLIPPTPRNLKYSAQVRDQILQDHALGKLDISLYFPDSKLAKQKPKQACDTFREWGDKWLTRIKPNIEATTHQEYRNALSGYFYPLWGDISLKELTKEMLADGLAGLKGTRGGEISGKTFNNVAIPLRSMLISAYDFEKIPLPLDGIIRTRAVQKAKPDPLELNEVEAILAKLSERYDLQIVNYFTLAFFTGLRPSEMISVEWRHVDWNNRTLRVEQAKVRAKLKGTKTHSARDVVLIDRAMDALERQKPYTYMLNAAIFHNPNTGQAFADTDFLVEKYWRPTLRALGIRDRDARQTRHTYATQALKAGARPGFVAQQLGHATTEMLHRVYSKWIDEGDNSKEAAKINQLYSQNVTGMSLEKISKG